MKRGQEREAPTMTELRISVADTIGAVADGEWDACANPQASVGGGNTRCAPESAGNGQQTFDQDLLSLHRGGFITVPEAIKHATNPDALTMALRGLTSSGSTQEARRTTTGPKPPPPAPVFNGTAKEH